MCQKNCCITVHATIFNAFRIAHLQFFIGQGKMNKILKFGLFLTTLVFSGVQANAAIFIIDDYSTPSSTTSSGGLVSETVSGPGILGGERLIELNKTIGLSNPMALTSDCNFVTPIIQCMSFNSGVASLGSLSLTYGLNTLTGMDVTNAGFNDGFLISIQFADLPTNFEIVVTDTSGSTASFMQQTPGLIFQNPNILQADFASFTGDLVDFSSIDEIKFSFDAVFPATDFQFNVVGTENFDPTNDPISTSTSVPESTPIISLMGLLAFGIISSVIRNQKVKF